jgi:hypothetical protein
MRSRLLVRFSFVTSTVSRVSSLPAVNGLKTIALWPTGNDGMNRLMVREADEKIMICLRNKDNSPFQFTGRMNDGMMVFDVVENPTKK